jgi:hypothetical protein
MIVSLHLCDETLDFVKNFESGVSGTARVLDAQKLSRHGLQEFAMANTGTDDFAAGALAMLEMLEATLGRAIMICHETDPKFIAERAAENSASSEPAP